jgi:hypothetical protein
MSMFHLKVSSSPRRLPGIGLACSYRGSDAGGDCYSENVMLVNRVSGMWRAWKGAKERKERELHRECSEEKQPWKREADTCQEVSIKLPTISDILLELME